jgi:hypothetical protein
MTPDERLAELEAQFAQQSAQFATPRKEGVEKRDDLCILFTGSPLYPAFPCTGTTSLG